MNFDIALKGAIEMNKKLLAILLIISISSTLGSYGTIKKELTEQRAPRVDLNTAQQIGYDENGESNDSSKQEFPIDEDKLDEAEVDVETPNVVETEKDPSQRFNDTTKNDKIIKTSGKKYINVKQIDWKVEKGEIETNEPVNKPMVLTYTNNSPYTITSVSIDFKQKDFITNAEFEEFNDIKEKENFTAKEVRSIEITAYNDKFAKPEETVTNSPCFYKFNKKFVENEGHFKAMVPATMRVTYIGFDYKLYTVNYDFASNTITPSSRGPQVMYEFENEKVKKIVPKPIFKSVHTYEDTEKGNYGFVALHVKKEEYDKYVEQCKKRGFFKFADGVKNYYHGTNAKGYQIALMYIPYEEKFRCNIVRRFRRIVWPKVRMSRMLPKPKSTIGQVKYNRSTKFKAYIAYTSKADFIKYVRACKSHGFTGDAHSDGFHYYAVSPSRYELYLKYIGDGMNLMTIQVTRIKSEKPPKNYKPKKPKPKNAPVKPAPTPVPAAPAPAPAPAVAPQA